MTFRMNRDHQNHHFASTKSCFKTNQQQKTYPLIVKHGVQMRAGKSPVYFDDFLIYTQMPMFMDFTANVGFPEGTTHIPNIFKIYNIYISPVILQKKHKKKLHNTSNLPHDLKKHLQNVQNTYPHPMKTRQGTVEGVVSNGSLPLPIDQFLQDVRANLEGKYQGG